MRHSSVHRHASSSVLGSHMLLQTFAKKCSHLKPFLNAVIKILACLCRFFVADVHVSANIQEKLQPLHPEKHANSKCPHRCSDVTTEPIIATSVSKHWTDHPTGKDVFFFFLCQRTACTRKREASKSNK